MLAIGIAGIAFYVRVMRGVVVSTREEVFVDATRALGATDLYVMSRAILPALIPYILVVCSLNVGFLILEAASLSFLGLGAQPPTAEWGAMLSEARQYVTVAPHVVLIPGVAILLVVVGLNLLGDALRDAFDIRHRRRRRNGRACDARGRRAYREPRTAGATRAEVEGSVGGFCQARGAGGYGPGASQHRLAHSEGCAWATLRWPPSPSQGWRA
jgi:hypothetical protein